MPTHSPAKPIRAQEIVMLRRETEARRRHAAVRAEMKTLHVRRYRLPLLPLAGAMLIFANVLAAVATLAKAAF
jgi:hypothetical protein